MSDSHKTAESASVWRAQIDHATWLELTVQCERIIDSFGLIGPILELGMDKSDSERLTAIKEISAQGHAALLAFALLWARLDEQAYRDGVRLCPAELGELRREARRSPIPEGRTVSGEAQIPSRHQVLRLELRAENDGAVDTE